MKKFFTLIELIVVIAVLGILAAIIIPNISSFQEEANDTAIISNVRNLQTSVDMYGLDHYGALPGVDTPEIGNPQPIDFVSITPKYNRDLPETEGVKYWVDAWGKVWASSIDSPTGVGNDGLKLTWVDVPEADAYHVYVKIKGSTSSVVNHSQLQFIGKETDTDFDTNDNREYFVSAIDKNGFESPPAGGDYLGYDTIVTLGTGAIFKSCLDAKTKKPSLSDGKYFVKPEGYSGDAFPVYCDMTTDGGGWTMVFKHSSQQVLDPYQLWYSGTGTENLNLSKNTSFANRTLIDNHWNSFTEARVNVVVNNNIQKYITYSTSATNKISWFTPSKVKSSSWSDLTSSKSYLYHSMEGYSSLQRRFYIENNHGGCENDAGWLYVLGTQHDTCTNWDLRSPGVIGYSTLDTYTKQANGNMGEADVLAIMVR